MIRIKRIITAVICTICFTFITPSEVAAKSMNNYTIESNQILTTEKIDSKINYTESAIKQDNEAIKRNEINQELTERINICKVNTEVSSTVDSINNSVSNITEQKKERDAAEEAARIAAEEAERKAKEEAERKAALEKYRENEINLLAAIIYCEAGGESYEGQVAVGAVILNRVKSNSFPNTIKEVIYQSGQFTPACNGTLDKVLINGNVNSSCLSAAKDAIAGSNPIGNCLYFRTLNGSSGLIIGNHVFR